MLTPEDRAAYVRLLSSDRSEYHVLCPVCRKWIETYEHVIVTHARTCKEGQ